MTKKSEIGRLGEDIACQYLLNKSFTIIDRNFRKPWGELDIITSDPDGVLVFVEVKTISQSGESEKYNMSEYAPNSLWQAIRQYGNTAMIKKMRQKISWKESSQIRPEDNLTSAKLKKLKRMASLYAGFNDGLISEEIGWRIDLIAITIPDTEIEGLIPLEAGARYEPSRPLTGLTELLKYCDIKHFENVE